MTLPAGRRRARFPPPAEADPAVPSPQISPLRFMVQFPEGRSCWIDLTESPAPAVGRELGRALSEMAQVGGRIRSVGSARSHQGAIRLFLGFLDAQEPTTEAGLVQVTPAMLDAFEVHLYGRSTSARTAFSTLTMVVALLRQVRDTRPALLHDDLPARLRLVGRRPLPPPAPGRGPLPAGGRRGAAGGLPRAGPPDGAQADGGRTGPARRWHRPAPGRLGR